MKYNNKFELPSEINLLMVASQLTLDTTGLNRMKNLISSNIEWPTIMSYSKKFGIQPFLFSHINQHRLMSYIPDTYYQMLKHAYQKQAMQTLYLKRQISELKELLSAKKIEFCLIKGAELIETIYSQTPVRCMSDIDILCHYDNMSTISNILKSHGYMQKTMHQGKALESLFTHRKHFPPFFHKNRHTIEIHFNLFSGLSIDESYTQNAWSTAVHEPDSSQCHLSKEHHLIFMCNHLAYHILSPQEGLVLYWFCDINEWIKKYHSQMNWHFLENLPYKQLKDNIFFILKIIQKEWDAPVPSYVCHDHNHHNHMNLSTIFQKTIVDNGYQRKKRVIDYYKKILLNKEEDWSIKKRVVYWFCLIFPQPGYVKDRYRVKKKVLIPLYMIVHPVILILRGFKRFFLK
jgi:hypothetical protein